MVADDEINQEFIVTQKHLDDLEREMHQHLKAGTERMDAMQADLKVNTEATERIEKNTARMVEFFNSVEGAFKTLEMIGKLAKPLTYLTMFFASLAGLWYALKGGRPHG